MNDLWASATSSVLLPTVLALTLSIGIAAAILGGGPSWRRARSLRGAAGVTAFALVAAAVVALATTSSPADAPVIEAGTTPDRPLIAQPPADRVVPDAVAVPTAARTKSAPKAAGRPQPVSAPGRVAQRVTLRTPPAAPLTRVAARPPAPAPAAAPAPAVGPAPEDAPTDDGAAGGAAAEELVVQPRSTSSQPVDDAAPGKHPEKKSKAAPAKAAPSKAAPAKPAVPASPHDDRSATPAVPATPAAPAAQGSHSPKR